MAARKSYNTRPLRLIREALTKKGGAHMTAEEISNSLKANGEPIGLTTVYRNLEKLCASGEVKKYIGDGTACYGFAGEHCRDHFHLKCSSCGRLFHIECDYMDRLSHHVCEHHGFKVDNSKTVLYGICEACGK